MKYYDVTFHGLSGRAVVKRTVPSEKEMFDAWQDACVKITDDELQIMVNETATTILRKYIARIDVEEVKDPIDVAQKRRDDFIAVVNTLSNMGF